MLCPSEECAAARKRASNLERERRYFEQHGEWRRAVLSRSNPEYAERERERMAALPRSPHHAENVTWHAAIRRARKRGAAAGDRFSREDVFERDGWLCGLCGAPVDRSLEHPDPMSRSLDHIVPVSRGGAHSFENVQLAHLICNTRKGNREGAVA